MTYSGQMLLIQPHFIWGGGGGCLFVSTLVMLELNQGCKLAEQALYH